MYSEMKLAFFVYIPLEPQNKGKKDICPSPFSSLANHTFVWVRICFNLVPMERINVVCDTFLGPYDAE